MSVPDAEYQKALDHIGYARVEINRLQAIVVLLPKCNRLDESGKLVQDCPVTLGMEIWHHRIAEGWVPDKVLGIFLAHGVLWLDVGCGPKIQPICCCNSREAAEALAAKGKEPE